MSKLSRELAKLDAKMTHAMLNSWEYPREWWERRWPAIVDRWAELHELGA